MCFRQLSEDGKHKTDALMDLILAGESRKQTSKLKNKHQEVVGAATKKRKQESGLGVKEGLHVKMASKSRKWKKHLGEGILSRKRTNSPLRLR